MYFTKKVYTAEIASKLKLKCLVPYVQQKASKALFTTIDT